MLSYSSMSKTRRLALLSLFAVVYTVLRLIPTFPMIGVTGTFSASDVVAPLYGLILGPYVGGGSVILGTFLAIAFGRPIIFLGLDFLPATVGAVSLGLLMQRRFHHVTILYMILTVVFLVHPLTLLLVTLPTGMAVPYSWLHLVALAILVSPLSRKAVNWVTSPSRRYLAQGLAVLCFIGTMAQHLTGAIVFENILGTLLGTIKPAAWPGVWTTTFYLYPVERTVIAAIATLVGSALITTLRMSRLAEQAPDKR